MTTPLIRRDFYATIHNQATDQAIHSHASTYETGSCIHLNFNPITILPEDHPSEEKINISFVLRYTPLFFGGWYSYECSNPTWPETLSLKALDLYNQGVRKVVVHHVISHTRENSKDYCFWEALILPIAALCQEIFPNLQKKDCQMIVYNGHTALSRNEIFTRSHLS